MFTCKRSDLMTDLDVIMWIPVHIINDDSVSCRKIDAKTTSTCGQQKYKLLRIITYKLN